MRSGHHQVTSEVTSAGLRGSRRAKGVSRLLAWIAAAFAFGWALESRADLCTPPIANPVACENSKPGNAQSEWQVSSDPSIQGFATDISVNKGGTVRFKVETNATAYRLDIYRMGYYGGLGAR